MKFSHGFAAGLVALGLSFSPAFAQQGQPIEHKPGDLPGPIDSLEDLQDVGRMVFAVADENMDGQVSQKEAVDAANVVVGGFFFRADQNGDGVLSQQEAQSAREAFFSQKPWLRYVVDTIRANPPGQAGGTAPNANAGGQPNNPAAAIGALLDSNSDKQIQASELRAAVQSAVQGAFAMADSNRDNQLTRTEINAAVGNAARTLAQAAFQQADSDNNGQISQAEFEKAAMEPTRTAFKIMDLNNDGQISQQEAQTARQVIGSKIRLLNMGEAQNSPRNTINRALTNPGAAEQPAQPAPPATAPGAATAPAAPR